MRRSADQAVLHGEDGGSDPVRDTELGDDGGHVRLDGGLAQVQPVGDLLVGQGLADECQDLQLTGGQGDTEGEGGGLFFAEGGRGVLPEPGEVG